MMKSKKIKVGTVVTIAFLAFSVVILVCIWTFQVIFLEDLYKTTTLNECRDTSNKVYEVYIDSPLTTSDQIEQLRLDPEIGLKIFSSSDIDEAFYSNVVSLNQNPFIDNPQVFFSKINKKNYYFSIENGYSVFVKLESAGSTNLYIVLTRPSENTRVTLNIMKQQSLAVTIGSLIMCFAISFIIGRMIAKPINEISQSVELLGPGQYDIDFPEGPYYETQKLSAALKKTAIEINKADQLQKDVMANVSHDIKTPLTLIKSYAEMIRDISGDDKTKREVHLQTIIDETDKLNCLINDILALSRAQADIQDEMKEFSLSSAVNESIVHFEEMAIAKNIQFGYDIADHIHIKANSEQISEVIYNFFSNAFNYTTDKIFVNLYVENSFAIFEVTDNGQGIPEDELNNIWQRYYRSANTHARTKGTGLGLSIVQTILDNHHFKFGVTSEVGVGSTFYFKAPILPAKKNG